MRSTKWHVARFNDLGLGKPRVEAEVERLERAFVLEVGAMEAELQLLPVATLDLVVEQAVQELGVVEVVVDGLLDAQRKRLEHPGEPELLEDGDEVVS